jgi:hypothetical protein
LRGDESIQRLFRIEAAFSIAARICSLTVTVTPPQIAAPENKTLDRTIRILHFAKLNSVDTDIRLP